MNSKNESPIKSGFISKTSTLIINTSAAPEFIDITDRITSILDKTDVSNGTVTIFSRHTTSAIVIQENEPLLLNDMSSLLEKLSPKSARYGHNDFTIRTVNMNEGEPPNGHSHCQHLLLGSSETIPIANGLLTLGQWQRIFVVELDESKITPREIVVQVLGV
jgi:secondary thiamine-phosphate synthase enzyme